MHLTKGKPPLLSQSSYIKMLKTNANLKEKNSSSYILIIEDDPDQMSLLVDFAQQEMTRIISNEHFDESQLRETQNIKVITATNIFSLKKAIQTHKNILLAILDCNIPDSKGGAPHDQFVKTAYKITGQHKAVDIVSKYLPGTPITMISSMNRFKKIVTQYYESKHDLSINFIRKRDAEIIKKNIAYYLRKHLS